MLNTVRKVFVVHYKQLIDRKEYMINYFKENNVLNYEFRDYYQREEVTDETLCKYSNTNQLSITQKCIAIEHIEIFKEIIKCGNNDDWYLILEDDAIFCDDFVNMFNKYMENKPEDAEYLDLSDYFTINTEELWYKHNATRTMCGYVIKKTTCEKILSTIIPLTIPIDHELNRQINLHSINMYWSGKSLIHHGSSEDFSNYYIKSY